MTAALLLLLRGCCCAASAASATASEVPATALATAATEDKLGLGSVCVELHMAAVTKTGAAAASKDDDDDTHMCV